HSSYFNDGIGLDNLATIVEGGTPTPDRPTPLEDALEHIEDGLDGVDRGVDFVQKHTVIHSPPVDGFIDNIIDGGQRGLDHAESTVLGMTETGINITTDLA